MLKRIDLKNSKVEDIKDILSERSQKDLCQYRQVAQDIIDDVKENKDKALFEYTSNFDKVDLDHNTVKVSQKEIDTALEEVDSEFFSALKKAALNIEKFHENQKESSWQQQSAP